MKFPMLAEISFSREKWQFNDPPLATERYFLESFDDYQLEGRILYSNTIKPDFPNFFAIHGAQSDYTKLNPFLYSLQAHGISSLSFNLSGHNKSSNTNIKNTSLGKNLQEALRFSSFLGKNLHTILGHSMGGALALKVAEAHGSNIKNIILSCPAIYSDAAYHQPFGVDFRQEIAIPFGFINSTSIEFLQKFKGKLMLIIGQHDGLKSIDFGGIAGKSAGTVKINDRISGISPVNSVIPFEVIKIIEDSVAPERFQKIVLPGCDHAVSGWLRANQVYADNLARQIVYFLKK